MVSPAWVLALVAFAGLAVGQPLLPTSGAWQAGPAPPSSVPAPDDGAASEPLAAADLPGASAAELLAFFERATGADADDPMAAAGLRGLAMLAQQPPQPPSGNATNSTTIPGFGNGTNTHHHGNVGNQGLGAVWASVFHGVPAQAIAADLDGDGTLDAVVGTDLGVSAVSGASGALMWSRHIGSTVTAVFAYGPDAAVPRVGYSTLWEGQTPRVGVVEGRTGAILWEHIGPAPFLTAAAADPTAATSDILAVDTAGMHVRLAGDTGEPMWESEADLLPDDITDGVAPNTVYANLGHYLAETGDLDGDGVTDTISVGAYHYAAGFNQYSLIVAVDGATGERLWTTNVGGDPHNIAQAIVYDVEALDSQGDGSMDIAYSFLVLRWEAIVAPVITWEQGWRVTKGDSTAVGVPIASRTLVTPMLVAEQFPDLDHTDVDGDGRDELAALRVFIANGLISDDFVTYERYALPLGSTGEPTLLAVSDVVVGAGGAGRITPFDLDADGAPDHGVVREVDGLSTWTVVTDDGQVLGPFDTGAIAVQAAAGLGDQVAVATRGAVQLRPLDLATVSSSQPLRGAPQAARLGDLDADGTPDVYVLASDGAVHVVDGVTGVAGRSYDVGPGVVDFQLGDLSAGAEPDLILLRDDPAQSYGPYLEGRSGGDNKILYGPDEGAFDPFLDVPGERPAWFDGDADGTLDALTGFDFGEFVARDGRNGKQMWRVTAQSSNGIPLYQVDHAVAARLDGAGDDLMVALPQGLLLLDGAKGKALGWHQFGNSTLTSTVRCMGAADGDGDGLQTVFAVHAGAAGDVARRLDGASWAILDWVPDEAHVVRCDLVPVPNGDGTEDLLATMVWDAGGNVGARVGRFDVAANAWRWDQVQARPDVESEAYAPLGVIPDGDGGGRLWLAWQDHAYAMQWGNGSLIGEFTVNGPFVVSGLAAELDGTAPSEAVIVAADGILWALAEDRGLVASRLAEKATDQGKDNNYGAGSSFEAPPPPPAKKKDKGFLPGPPTALVGAMLLFGVALARRINRD